jgi:hypothetical protein
MPKKTKAGGGDTKDTEVAIIILNHDADAQQLAKLKALAESLAPQFLAKIGATGEQVEVTVADRHCRQK